MLRTWILILAMTGAAAHAAPLVRKPSSQTQAQVKTGEFGYLEKRMEKTLAQVRSVGSDPVIRCYYIGQLEGNLTHLNVMIRRLEKRVQQKQPGAAELDVAMRGRLNQMDEFLNQWGRPDCLPQKRASR